MDSDEDNEIHLDEAEDEEMETEHETRIIEGSEADSTNPKTKYRTSKYMTKYERARLLGTRALQIRSE